MYHDTRSPSAASFAMEIIASNLRVRKATISDLEVMLDIGLSAMPMDPQWDWRFPHRLQFPEDTRCFTRQKYREFLDDKTGRWQVMVAEALSSNDNSPVTIAMAVWEVGNLNRRGSPKRRRQNSNSWGLSTHNPIRRDGDPKRIQTWTAVTTKSKAEIFDGIYGFGHIHLQILATHPAYHRRGAGRALCDWGIQLAERNAMAISVFASPMGRILYRRMGFLLVTEVRIQAVEDEHEGVVLAAMTFIPQSIVSAWKRVIWEEITTRHGESEDW